MLVVIWAITSSECTDTGKYSSHCTIHAGMSGKVVVGDQ
jgi:plastocyanin